MIPFLFQIYSHDTKTIFLAIEIVKHRDLQKKLESEINFIAVANLQRIKHDSFAINKCVCDNVRSEQRWSKITGISKHDM